MHDGSYLGPGLSQSKSFVLELHAANGVGDDKADLAPRRLQPPSWCYRMLCMLSRSMATFLFLHIGVIVCCVAAYKTSLSESRCSYSIQYFFGVIQIFNICIQIVSMELLVTTHMNDSRGRIRLHTSKTPNPLPRGTLHNTLLIPLK